MCMSGSAATGRWLKQLAGLGIRHLDHVLLTHHHADQCWGLRNLPRRKFTVPAPMGEERFPDPRKMREGGTLEALRCGRIAGALPKPTTADGVLYWWK